MEQGPIEAKIIQDCVRMGRPLPRTIANAPQLLPGLEFFYLAFCALTTERALGMGIGQIPWSKIEMYCDVVETDDEQREYMHLMIRAMDTAYLDYRTKESKVES